MRTLTRRRTRCTWQRAPAALSPVWQAPALHFICSLHLHASEHRCSKDASALVVVARNEPADQPSRPLGSKLGTSFSTIGTTD